MAHYRDSVQEDVFELAAKMRQADVKEVLASNGSSPLEAQIGRASVLKEPWISSTSMSLPPSLTTARGFCWFPRSSPPCAILGGESL